MASFLAVLLLAAAAFAGVRFAGLYGLFGIAAPYAAAAVFIAGVIFRVLRWARSPVPFRIALTSGQAKSLSWIKPAALESPSGAAGVTGRMLLEALFFRSLFRNSRADLAGGGRPVYGSSKWLWAGAMAFHWSLLVVIIRHLRFFTEPVPAAVAWLQGLDGLFETGVPALYITDAIILASLSYLLIRRLSAPQLRYISLVQDYFPLALLLGIAASGAVMRHFTRVDLAAVKTMALGLARFTPAVPEGIGAAFYIHLFLACVLIAYFPFSKLMHMAGVFLSPTRNMANTSRVMRHVNPWNPAVKAHSYGEWEDEFRERLKSAGYAIEKE